MWQLSIWTLPALDVKEQICDWIPNLAFERVRADSAVSCLIFFRKILWIANAHKPKQIPILFLLWVWLSKN